MNILMVNWTWHPSGGDWTYVENMSNLYEKAGHKVIPFAMHHPDNYPNAYESYFIKNRDYRQLNDGKWWKGAEIATESIYSFEAMKLIKKLLLEVKIDLAHLNIIHRYQTPAIIKVLKKANIPIVWTLHDYTILCPEGTFVSNGKICEACKGGQFHQVILNKCKKQSLLASTLACVDNYINEYLDYYSLVDYYICPSKFLHQKFLNYGFNPDKLHQLYHSYTLSQIPEIPAKETNVDEKYIVFIGRLEKIKGIHTLLEAMKECPSIPLKIIGDGTEMEKLKAFADQNQLHHVSFLGKMDKTQLWPILLSASFMVFPSECLEILGFSIIEAMLCNKAVIGSNIGAIPETIIDGQTGLLFEPGNVKMLAEKIQSLYNDEKLSINMGMTAGNYIRELTHPEKYYEDLKKIIPVLN